MYRFLFIVLSMLQSALIFGLPTSGPFIQLSPTTGNGVPELAVAINGNAFAAWVDFPNTIQTSFFNASINPPIGQWFFLGNLSLGGTAPQIDIDQNGNAYVIWVTTPPSGSNIFVSRFSVATMSFSIPMQLSTPGTINFAPQISVNDLGFALAIWMQNAPFQILSSSFTPPPGAGWSVPTPILNNTYPSRFQIDNVNHGIAIFQTFQGVIQAARLFIP